MTYPGQSLGIRPPEPNEGRMNEAMPRLRGDTRSTEPSVALPDMPMVWCASHLPNTWSKGRPTKAGSFSPSIFGAPGVDGTRAQRIAAADAMRRWMFDPTPEQLGPTIEETKVSEAA